MFADPVIRPAPLVGEAAQQLARWKSLVAEGRAAEAVERLVPLLDQHRDDLVPAIEPPSEFARLQPVREHVRDFLAESVERDRASAVVAEYRRRFDATLRRNLAAAFDEADGAALRDLAHRHWLSAVGEAAMLALGDLHFGAGRLDEAESWWGLLERRLARPLVTSPAAGQPNVELSGAVQGALLEPVTATDLVARRVLLLLARGDKPAAERLWERTARESPDATGWVWGQRQRWSSVIEPLLRPGDVDSPSGPTRSGTPLPRSAGRDDPRQGLGVRPARQWAPGVLRAKWSVPRADAPIPNDATEGDASASTNQRSWPWTAQPRVWRDRLIVPDLHGCTVHDLATGEVIFDVHPFVSGSVALDIDASSAARNVPSIELAGDRLCMVLPTDTGSGAGQWQSRVIVVDLAAEGRLLAMWETPGAGEQYVGTPLLDEISVWLASRGPATSGLVSIGRYDIATGRRVWHCQLPQVVGLAIADSSPSALDLALTRAGHRIVVSGAIGQIVALDADFGHVAWAMRYPVEPATTPRLVGGQPFRDRRAVRPLRSDRCLVFALGDRANLLALDELTGKVLWQTRLPSGTLDAIEIAGRVGDKVLAAGQRVWRFSWSDGQLIRSAIDNPFPLAASQVQMGGPAWIDGADVVWSMRTAGRGDQLYVLDVHQGTWTVAPQPLEPRGLRVGRWMRHDDYWIVATERDITVLSR